MQSVTLIKGEQSCFNAESTVLSTNNEESSRVTVLMADIISSTQLSEKLSPNDLRDLLLDYYQTCDDIVTQYHGRTLQYSGDGIMSVFGAPYAEKGTATDAVHAGLQICSKKFHYADSSYEIRVAAASGDVATSNRIGPQPYSQNKIFGTAPFLAARLQALAPPSSLVFDESTFLEVGDRFSTCSMGQRKLRGFQKPQPFWLVKKWPHCDLYTFRRQPRQA